MCHQTALRRGVQTETPTAAHQRGHRLETRMTTPHPSSAAITQRRRSFRQLHESGCFVLPNPWDAGSARYLQGLGFKALATTSSGAAWSMAMGDHAVGLDSMLNHIRAIVAATDLPVNADFEGCFADDPEGVA